VHRGSRKTNPPRKLAHRRKRKFGKNREYCLIDRTASRKRDKEKALNSLSGFDCSQPSYSCLALLTPRACGAASLMPRCATHDVGHPILQSGFLIHGKGNWNNISRYKNSMLDELNGASGFIRFGSVNVEMLMGVWAPYIKKIWRFACFERVPIQSTIRSI
jgi:hypothetical protein